MQRNKWRKGFLLPTIYLKRILQKPEISTIITLYTFIYVCYMMIMLSTQKKILSELVSIVYVSDMYIYTVELHEHSLFKKPLFPAGV